MGVLNIWKENRKEDKVSSLKSLLQLHKSNQSTYFTVYKQKTENNTQKKYKLQPWW